MDPNALRKICLDKPGAFEDFPFGEQVSTFDRLSASTEEEISVFWG